MNKPIISVITPCYNASRTIRDAIDSVLKQTFEDWELIVIDDCSSDNSVEIIAEYIELDNRVKLLRTSYPSGSPSLPRNMGIESSVGEYIAFLDADDIWLPKKLEQQIEFMRAGKYVFTYSNYEKISAEGYRSGRNVKMPKVTSFWDVIETCSIPCLTVLINRKLIGSTRFKQVPKEDFIFWIDILKKDVKAFNVGEVLALYREQPKSRSGNKIDMVRSQWQILREELGVKPIVAAYLMIKYLYFGFLKYLI